MFKKLKKASRPFLIIMSVIAVAAMAGTGFAATSALDAINAPLQNPSSGQSAPVNTQVLQKITVSAIQGDVYIRKAGNVLFERVTSDTDIHMGDSVKTENGSCDLLMENHTNLGLKPGTVLEITEATYDKLSQSRATVLKLDMGRLKAKIGKLAQGSKFEVLTPTAVAAVRGTVFFLDAGTALGKLFTELYVDESSGGVVFRNTKTGAEFLVPKFGASSAFEDGSLLAPHFLNEEERKQFVQQWENAVNKVLAQNSVEEQSNSGGSSQSGSGDTSKTDDSQNDKNISGNALNQFILNLLRELSDNQASIASLANDATVKNEDFQNKFQALEPVDPSALIRKSEGTVPGNSDTKGGFKTFASASSGEWTYDSVSYTAGTSPFGTGDKAASGNGDQGIVASTHSTLTADVRANQQNAGTTLSQVSADASSLDSQTQQLGDIYTQSLTDTGHVTDLLNQAEILKTSFDSGLQDGQNALDSFNAANDAFAQDAAAIEAAREAEREALRNEIRGDLDRIEKAIAFDQRVAQFEKTLDAQTGKVFTDIHGNRVRTDQYIFRPDGQSVEILSLTLRAPSQITSAAFNIRFNNLPAETSLRSLPWNDYLTIVTQDDLNNTLSRGQSDPGYDQYIVYQSLSPGQNPSIYPTAISAEFRSPQSDSILFNETYTAPFSVHLDTGFHSSAFYKVQGKSSDSTTITPSVGDKVQLTNTFNTHTRSYDQSLKVNNVSISDRNYDVDHSEGSQTSSFNHDYDHHGLRDTSYYLDSFSTHPAFFSDVITVDTGKNSESVYSLSGLFLPIDNQGNLIEATGFQIRGIRDLIHPNPQVNDGNYNLEVIFSYDQTKSGRDSHNRPFSTSNSFGIDAIITPEIFTDYGRVDASESDNLLFGQPLDHSSSGHFHWWGWDHHNS